MILKGDEQEIELIIEGYEYIEPKSDDFWDKNWLMLYCRKTFGSHTICGRFPCFLTTELIRLHEMLQQFLCGEICYVEWGGTEPNLSISLHREKNTCMLEIFFYPENGTESFDEVKVFRKNAVKEDIVQLINFCEENISKYPVRKTETNLYK